MLIKVDHDYDIGLPILLEIGEHITDGNDVTCGPVDSDFDGNLRPRSFVDVCVRTAGSIADHIKACDKLALSDEWAVLSVE